MAPMSTTRSPSPFPRARTTAYEHFARAGSLRNHPACADGHACARSVFAGSGDDAGISEWFCERALPDLSAQDVVIEPCAGTGNIPAAIPSAVRAFGVKLDPRLAAIAAARTKHRVIVGDIRSVLIDVQPSCAISNPMFKAVFIRQLLDRMHALLPEDGRVSLLVPVSLFNAARPTVRLAERWNLHMELVPREFFGRLSLPICLCSFVRSSGRIMVGFAGYHELLAIRALPRETQAVLNDAPDGAWRTVVTRALTTLGGEATLDQIYAAIQGHRRTHARPFWRDRVRAICGERFTRVGVGRFRLAS
jgi:adenine-specific DNA-methyltransferase